MAIRIAHSAQGLVAAIALASAGMSATPGLAQDASPPAAAEPDNGTDPTRIRTQAKVSWEHIGVTEDISTDRVEFSYGFPLGPHTGITFYAPLAAADFGLASPDDLDYGDVSVELTHVKLGGGGKYGLVYKGELILDTAARPELGDGQTVLKATFIYARFLPDRSIFAPSFVQSWGFDPASGQDRVNNMVVDFYYVPHLSNPNVFVTVDPALIFDWEKNTTSASIGVQFGHAVGHAFGGTAQVYIKPTVYMGNDRPADWGVEVGYKLIGF